MAQNYTSIDDLIKLLDQAAPSISAPSTAPSQPISLPKEAGPARSTPEYHLSGDTLPLQEAVEKQEVEPDVQPFVQVKPQNIKIEPDLKKHGLQPIEKLKYKDVQNVVLPISDEVIEKGLHQPLTSSLRWLATFALYLLNQSHLKLKVVHGKVVRVLVK
jgi:hypothetical protein